MLGGCAAFGGDVGREACGFQLLLQQDGVRLDRERAALHLVEYAYFHEVGVEAGRFDFCELRLRVLLARKGARLDAVEGLVRLRLRGGDNRGDRRAEALVDLVGYLPVPLVEVCAGARLVGEPSMDGHVLLFRLPDEGFVGFPFELLDAVALADVDQQVNEGGVGFRVHRIRLRGVACDFDGDGAVVVRAG